MDYFLNGFKMILLGAFLSFTSFAQDAGQVRFENTGAPEAQAAFHYGLAQLHNFEYATAATAFRQAQAIDPGFVMAYWGEAMTENHILWPYYGREKAQAILAKFGPDRETRLAKIQNPRERAYFEAVEILFSQGSQREVDMAYADTMERVYLSYPDDVDARAFYAVANLTRAGRGRDFSIYMRSASMLEEIFEDNKGHPGVLHYLIHSYDDPVHAPLGLRAARLYADVAPDAAHAQHMVSHIFVSMGMWDEVIKANINAARGQKATLEARGEEMPRCEHYEEWLYYGYIQKGDLERAEAQFDICRNWAKDRYTNHALTTPMEPNSGNDYGYSKYVLMWASDQGELPPGEKLEMPNGNYLRSLANIAYAEALAVRGNAALLSESRERLTAAHERERAYFGDNRASFVRRIFIRKQAIDMQIQGLYELASGDTETGLATLRAAAELEYTLPFQFGPPAIAKPGYELLGEEYERLGRFREAYEAYREAAKRTPGRRIIREALSRLE